MACCCCWFAAARAAAPCGIPLQPLQPLDCPYWLTSGKVGTATAVVCGALLPHNIFLPPPEAAACEAALPQPAQPPSAPKEPQPPQPLLPTLPPQPPQPLAMPPPMPKAAWPGAAEGPALLAKAAGNLSLLSGGACANALGMEAAGASSSQIGSWAACFPWSWIMPWIILCSSACFPGVPSSGAALWRPSESMLPGGAIAAPSPEFSASSRAISFCSKRMCPAFMPHVSFISASDMARTDPSLSKPCSRKTDK
mmetsp:Transcript_100542/g.224643  ORF Transcript_100542/g.224643 Transcript_100542/m.224643 type:complete len:253 (+) Transcript_100542:454-1212(+)